MNRRHHAASIVLLALLGAGGAAQDRDGAGPHRPVVGRSMVATTFGIVAASQPLAARAGVQILERGGNAIDAAIAANATIGLMEPTGNGIGGDLFIIYYEAKTGTVHGLNASGWAPSGLTVEHLAAKGITAMPQRGIHSVTVPGVVAGWDAMRSKFGSKPFAELLAPAIYYAEHGFPLSETIARGWGNSVKMHSEHPNSRKTYLVDGVRAPAAGEIFRNPDLAGSLRLIAAHGRDGYYTGKTAEAILAISREQGGTMTAADLTEFQPEWVTPITTSYRGWTVHEIGPNTQGISALMMLNLMEQYPMAEYGFHSPDALHVMIEAKKLAYADMLRYVGDPAFSRIPVEALLNKPRAAARARLIDAARAACRVQPDTLAGVTDAEGADTIYLSVIDKDGNIVSLIQSNYSGFGSGLVPPGAGFMLHNRGGLFTLEPGQPNTLAPRKRPLHTIIPGLHGEGRAADRLRNHGRLEPGPGARAVRLEHRRLRDDHSAGARGRALHQGQLRGLRRLDRVAGARGGARAADRARARAPCRRAAHRDVRLRPGRDERARRGALRRLRAAPRRRGGAAGAAGVRHDGTRGHARGSATVSERPVADPPQSTRPGRRALRGGAVAARAQPAGPGRCRPRPRQRHRADG